MEQKTEASQAVYYPPFPEPHHERDDCDGTVPFFTAGQMLAYARAALKAQPALTEAAQGEDSARLDAERYRFATGIDGDRVHIDWSASKDEIDATIDRARASAETGGVKP